MPVSWQPGFSLDNKPSRRSQTRRGQSGLRKDRSNFRYVEFSEEASRGNVPGAGPSKIFEDDAQQASGIVADTSVDSTTKNVTDPSTDNRIFDIDEAVWLGSQEHDSDGSPAISASGLVERPDALVQLSSDNEGAHLEDDFEQSISRRDHQRNGETSPWSAPPSVSRLRRSQFTFAQSAILPAGSDASLARLSPRRSITIPPSPLYNDLSHRFQAVFDRYDHEFCKIPLTDDMAINPFRCRSNLSDEPMLLVHAVMALGGHHVDSTSTVNHQGTALSLLRGSLASYNKADIHTLIDAIIVLFSYDETQSILGHWATHLIGAYGLIEAYGGVYEWLETPRAQVQLALLVWWDALLSLVAWDDCIFPMEYFEALDAASDQREWDHYSLSGCPMSLVRVTMRLARMSAAKHKCRFMDYIVDENAISDVESALEEWHHVSDLTAVSNEEDMQRDQDRMHCSEAWRCGLQLYVYRVFRWRPGMSAPISVLFRAREVVDHIFACRTETLVAKQALLALFFAACELKDPIMRERIKQFCNTCDMKSRYHMFNGSVVLMELVWAAQEVLGRENVWWGSIVEKFHQAESTEVLPKRVCFG